MNGWKIIESDLLPSGSGNNFPIAESVTGELVRVPQVKEIAQARQHGNLEAGSYMLLRRIPGEKMAFDLQDLGDANLVFFNERFVQENSSRLRDKVPENIGGWLGQLREAVTIHPGKQKDKRRSV